MHIPFNKPHFTGEELKIASRVPESGTVAGNGAFTKKCHDFFEKKYGFGKALLTTSCTDALEMAAILCDIREGDEVIMPSYTFVSTANAFILRGARVVFADTLPDLPNIDPRQIESLITPKTKAIVVVHYAGIACDMDRIMELARENNLKVVEDAAHAIDSYYYKKPLGSIGHFGTLSFHETKNIICGEGGLLAINDKKDRERAEIIWEKGTNRAAFYRGEVDKYGWVDIGSSFLPSDIMAAFLYSQLTHLDDIQAKRIAVWKMYHERLALLEETGNLMLPRIPGFATNNGHIYYIVTNTPGERVALLKYLQKNDIQAIFHYLPLHESLYFHDQYHGSPLPNTLRFSECLVRLPLFYDLGEEEIEYITGKIIKFFGL